MDFEIVQEAMMRKKAANDAAPGGVSAEEAQKWIPSNVSTDLPKTQLLRNFSDWFNTYRYNKLHDRVRGLAHTFLGNGPAYNAVRDFVHGIAPGFGYDQLLSSFKPKREIKSFADIFKIKPAVDESVMSVPTKGGKGTHTQQLIDEKNSWKQHGGKTNTVTDDRALRKGVGNLPGGNRLTAMALQEAANTQKYQNYYDRGWTQQDVANMLLNKYYVPSLQETLGTKAYGPSTELTDDQWANMRKHYIQRQRHDIVDNPAHAQQNSLNFNQQDVNDIDRYYGELWDKNFNAHQPTSMYDTLQQQNNTTTPIGDTSKILGRKLW